jgi:hypothetical protein
MSARGFAKLEPTAAASHQMKRLSAKFIAKGTLRTKNIPYYSLKKLLFQAI